MKIAFCISGLFKPSTTYSEAYENKFAYLTEKIKKYNADTFIYSFSKEIESKVVDIFKPKNFTSGSANCHTRNAEIIDKKIVNNINLRETFS